jgi:hypothetical protein
MCGRYASFLPANALAKLLGIVNPLPNLQPTWNMAPTLGAPVVRMHGSQRHLDVLKWGLIPYFTKDLNNTMSDSPDNTAASSARRYMWRLSEKILIAFHQACDQRDLEVAERLLAVLEMVISGRWHQPTFPDQRGKSPLTNDFGTCGTLTRAQRPERARHPVAAASNVQISRGKRSNCHQEEKHDDDRRLPRWARVNPIQS